MSSNFSQYPSRIASARQNKGISQEKLALAIGINPKTIAKIELGISQPKFDTVYKISQELGVPLSELAGQAVSVSALSRDELTELIESAVRKAIREK